ncbi:MAG: hypothetical protein EPN97_05485 [Alphaproteobacteria bacterium]|nr:MAG: hypothetical protein EPN97_05485 [Alphaproteobacteria bacterium]
MNSRQCPVPPSKSREHMFADPWEGWKPAWGRGDATPHALQERHSPSMAVALRAPQGRSAECSQRRIVDARLWEAMTQAQQDAALEIARVFESLSRGIGFQVSDWTKTPSMRGGANPAEIHARLLSGYVDWTLRCRKAGVSHSMIIDVLVFGFSCQALDSDRRVRKGSTKANLLKGLSLYCEVKGWPS